MPIRFENRPEFSSGSKSVHRLPKCRLESSFRQLSAEMAKHKLQSFPANLVTKRFVLSVSPAGESKRTLRRTESSLQNIQPLKPVIQPLVNHSYETWRPLPRMPILM